MTYINTKIEAKKDIYAEKKDYFVFVQGYYHVE
jgi:hypothetical protein